MNIGDRVVYKPIDFRFGQKRQNTENLYYGTFGTVIKKDFIAGVIKRYVIALDNFPNCNDRKSKNKTWALEEEISLHTGL